MESCSARNSSVVLFSVQDLFLLSTKMSQLFIIQRRFTQIEHFFCVHRRQQACWLKHCNGRLTTNEGVVCSLTVNDMADILEGTIALSDRFYYRM